MRALIVEDEDLASDLLLNILQNQQIIEFYEIRRADSFESAAGILANFIPDVIFLDIQLGDGTGFDLLDTMQPPAPVVFLTAHEEYALKAHDYNALGYITKPFDRGSIYKLLTKIGARQKSAARTQRRFLVSEGSKMLSLKESEIAYFYAEGKNLFIHSISGDTYLYGSTLGKVAESLDPRLFFKINRNVCLNIEAVSEVHRYSGQRLCVVAVPPFPQEEMGIVAKASLADFKHWLNH
ncbi:LytR/AlgR family response regulator transcription factor [Cruoricaptor ignavus]|uniref:LytR/AlgR family response regulator transcription factor n=1 Tax=Cruoricaptor ignavus TaxID=1118202 RepID=UPI00370DCA2D